MNYKLYHDSMYNTFQEVKRFVKENGFEIDEENWDREVQAQGSWADVEHIDAGQTKKYKQMERKNSFQMGRYQNQFCELR